MILVTGAGGQVGKALLQALSARGLDTRAWIHSRRDEEAVLAAGAKEVLIGDMASAVDAAEAIKGTDTIYFICNTANPQEDEIGAQLIDLAKKSGGITFIYHSVMHALLSDMPHHKRKLAVEKALVDAGIPYVILQPAVFMQMLAPAIHSVKNGGPFVQKFYVSGRTRMSFVDLRDYAEAAAAVVAAGTYTFGTYELCSEGAFSLTDLEEMFSELAGRKVTSAFIQDSDFLAASHTDPDSYAGRTLLTMFRHYNENGFCGNPFTLTQILGRRPVSLRAYLENALQGM